MKQSSPNYDTWYFVPFAGIVFLVLFLLIMRRQFAGEPETQTASAPVTVSAFGKIMGAATGSAVLLPAPTTKPQTAQSNFTYKPLTTPTKNPTATPTPTPTFIPTQTPATSPTHTPTPTFTPTPTNPPDPTSSPTLTPTSTPTATPTPTLSVLPSLPAPAGPSATDSGQLPPYLDPNHPAYHFWQKILRLLEKKAKH